VRHKVARSRRVRYSTRSYASWRAWPSATRWRRLSEQLHAVLVDPDFDLDAPVDLADLMAVIAEHHEAEPPESPVEAPRRDEFPGGPQ